MDLMDEDRITQQENKFQKLCGLSGSCTGCCESCYPVCMKQRQLLVTLSPSLSLCVDRDSPHKPPGLTLETRFFFFSRPVQNEKRYFSPRSRHKNATDAGVNLHKDSSLTTQREEKSCLRPASTVAHAAFQDLLSCGQRPRSQPPGTLTYTRRPAARHSRRIRPITTRALPPRHLQGLIESVGGGERTDWLERIPWANDAPHVLRVHQWGRLGGGERAGLGE